MGLLQHRRFNSRKTLYFLTFVAFTAFVSIVLISHQLVGRFMQRQQAEIEQSQVIELDILTLKDWAQKATSPQGQITSPRLEFAKEKGLKIIEDGIFWSEELEARIPPGLEDQEVQDIVLSMRQKSISHVQKSDRMRCGRPPNKFVQFEDGSHACAKQRPGHDEYVQGEVMAFYFARMLGIKNTPAIALSQVSFDSSCASN